MRLFYVALHLIMYVLANGGNQLNLDRHEDEFEYLFIKWKSWYQRL